MAERQFELTRDTLAVVFLFALIAASVWILWPLLAAVVWATMIVVATWPMLLMLQRWLLGRRWLAVTVMTLLLLAIFLLPFLFAIGTFIENFKEITDWTTSLANFKLPPPPDWLGKIPLVGARVTSNWQQLAALSHEEMTARLSPYLGGIVRWLAGQIGGGTQTPGFVGIGKLYISSAKFISAEGGIERLVWMPKALKEEVEPRLRERLKKIGKEDLLDKIATEEQAETPDKLVEFLTSVEHPALALAPLM